MWIDDQDYAQIIGDHLKRWRILLGLSQQLTAERAGISVPTLRKIETGDPGVRLGHALSVMNVLGVDRTAADAVDPLNSDLGKLRVAESQRQRARRTP